MALIPAGTRLGAPYIPNAKRFSCTTSNAVYIGDPVVRVSGGGTTAGIPSCDICGATAAPHGVTTGIISTAYDSTPYKSTSTTERILLVETDPNILYSVGEDGGGAYMAATNISNVADLTGIGTGSNNTGISSVLIDSSTAASGSSAQVVLWGLAQIVGNAYGSSSTLWLAYLNEAQLVAGSSSNGV